MEIKIYQINRNRDKNFVKFLHYKHLDNFQETKDINASIYDEVFRGDADCEDLEDVYRMLLVGVPLVCWGEQLWTAYPWLEPVAAVLSALVVAVMFQDSFRREAESLLRQHWASLNGAREKE